MTTAFDFSPMYWKIFADGSRLLGIEDLEIGYHCRVVEGGTSKTSLDVSNEGVKIDERHEYGEAFLLLIGQFMESL